jgi:hypothetical protein
MKTQKLAVASILLAAFFAITIPATANENPSQTQTSLSNTSLSGYSDSSIEWELQPPVSNRNNGWWWDIMVWFGFERR